jgi:class 3 adenylate cyclase
MTDGAGTFVFADIAGFAALTEAHGDEEALKLVETSRMRSGPSGFAACRRVLRARSLVLLLLRSC